MRSPLLYLSRCLRVLSLLANMSRRLANIRLLQTMDFSTMWLVQEPGPQTHLRKQTPTIILAIIIMVMMTMILTCVQITFMSSPGQVRTLKRQRVRFFGSQGCVVDTITTVEDRIPLSDNFHVEDRCVSYSSVCIFCVVYSNSLTAGRLDRLIGRSHDD